MTANRVSVGYIEVTSCLVGCSSRAAGLWWYFICTIVIIECTCSASEHILCPALFTVCLVMCPFIQVCCRSIYSSPVVVVFFSLSCLMYKQTDTGITLSSVCPCVCPSLWPHLGLPQQVTLTSWETLVLCEHCVHSFCFQSQINCNLNTKRKEMQHQLL